MPIGRHRGGLTGEEGAKISWKNNRVLLYPIIVKQKERNEKLIISNSSVSNFSRELAINLASLLRSYGVTVYDSVRGEKVLL